MWGRGGLGARGAAGSGVQRMAGGCTPVAALPSHSTPTPLPLCYSMGLAHHKVIKSAISGVWVGVGVRAARGALCTCAPHVNRGGGVSV